MVTDEAKQIYKKRASVAEWLDAQRRNHGLQQFVVRGRRKVRCIALWHALVNNLLQIFHIGLPLRANLTSSGHIGRFRAAAARRASRPDNDVFSESIRDATAASERRGKKFTGSMLFRLHRRGC